MFVFGEVQDPTTETVNLVEDIVRGQIIELVRDSSPQPLVMQIAVAHCVDVRLSVPPRIRINALTTFHRSFKHVTWPAGAGHDTSLRRTSYSSSVTIVRK